jgi:XTP/dITP diphosphohydrolase
VNDRLVLVAATANPAKLSEIAAILGDALGDGFVLSPRPSDLPDVVEDAPDLVGNARLKAEAVMRATGSSAVADDSGLEVDALGGAPGVRSARFAGEEATDADNVALLLDRLGDETERGARFRTVAYVARPDGSSVVAEGTCEGTIALSARGEGGFGYDPVFVPADGDGRTFAEMSPDEKHAISHRGRAFGALAARLGIS